MASLEATQHVCNIRRRPKGEENCRCARGTFRAAGTVADAFYFREFNQKIESIKGSRANADSAYDDSKKREAT